MKTIDVVLARPQIPENVGFAARSMKAFGVGRLVLVAPAFPWSGESPAYKTASGASDVLDEAVLAGSLEDAVGEHQTVVGFSRRGHDFSRPLMDLVSWCDALHQAREADRTRRVALVFGPEDYGLSTADKRLCQVLVDIPTAVETLSLNLAHAVTVVLYEISRTTVAVPAEQTATDAACTHAEIQRVIERLVGILDRTAFFKTGRRERQTETLRNIVFRLGLTGREYGAVMGLLAALDPSERTPPSQGDGP